MSPHIYQAIVVAKALRLYEATATRVNRAYSPHAMMQTATRITGINFHARAYLEAAMALEQWAKGNNHE